MVINDIPKNLHGLWPCRFFLLGFWKWRYISAGAYIITACKYGCDWFIAGITDTTAKDITVPLSFLDAGNYTATICKDGINADRNAADYNIEQKILDQNLNLSIHLSPNGGFLISVKKE